jgi:hypothetical protein
MQLNINIKKLDKFQNTFTIGNSVSFTKIICKASEITSQYDKKSIYHIFQKKKHDVL